MRLLLQAKFARTTKVWPGTFNPNPPLDIYPASKVTAFEIGAKYAATLFDRPFNISTDYSRFVAEPDGAPWHRQTQLVLGLERCAISLTHTRS